MSDRKLSTDGTIDPSWKSAGDLGISPTEYMALVAVREAFIKGDIRHVDIEKRGFLFSRDEKIVYRHPDSKMFNFAWEDFRDDCGTSYCIGGWVFQTMRPGASGRDTRAYVKAGRSQALHDLFYGYHGDMRKLKELDAAQAIGRFLSGKPAW